MGRSRRIFLAALCVAGSTVGVAFLIGVFAANDDPADELVAPTTPAPEAEQLYNVLTWPLRDNVWVYTGIAGPEGSAPPVSTLSGPGWSPNRTVSEYSADGELLRRVRLPAGAEPSGGPAVAVGDSTYLFANDRMVEIEGDDATVIDLELPPAELTVTNVLSAPMPIGAHEQWILAWQDDGGGTIPPSAPSDDRLLRIDRETGEVTVIELPPLVPDLRSAVCLRGGDLYIATATLVDVDLLSEVAILTRPVDSDSSDWSPVATIGFDRPRVSGGSLQCLQNSDELLVQVRATPPMLVTVPLVPEGEPVFYADVLEDDDIGLHWLGIVGGRELFASDSYRYRASLYARTADGSFERVIDGLESTTHLVVLDDSLHDATGLTTSTDPSKVSIEPVDVGF